MNMNNTVYIVQHQKTGTTNSKLQPIRNGVDDFGTNFAAADDLNQVSPPFPFFLRFLVLVRPPLKIIQCDDDLLLTEHFITEDDILLCES